MSNYELHADYIKLCQSRKATRKELVNICLPKVDPNLQVEDVAPVFGEFVTQNPLVLKSRPSESVTTAALNTLSTCHNLTAPFDDNCIVINEKNDPNGVALGELGTFDVDSINVFKTFCDISEMQKNYQFEMAWLQQQCSGHSVEDITLVSQKSPLNNSNVIVLQEDLFVDFKSVTSLIGEIWVDNFVINFFLNKFIAFDCEQHKEKVIASLPIEAFNWIESKERNVDRMLRANVDNGHHIQFLLLPIHVSGCHWGLACIDFVNFVLWFDDGLGWDPLANLTVVVRYIVHYLGSIYVDACHFNSENWNEQALTPKRFGMPKQQTMSSEDSGSCGIGVILACHDIIHSKTIPTPFSWNFEESSYHRMKLLLLILKEWTPNFKGMEFYCKS